MGSHVMRTDWYVGGSDMEQTTCESMKSAQTSSTLYTIASIVHFFDIEGNKVQLGVTYLIA